jgi:hypothetical protein
LCGPRAATHSAEFSTVQYHSSIGKKKERLNPYHKNSAVYMPTSPDNPESSGVHGPRKRILSTKASTNGDPIVERKRKKLEEVQKKGATTTLTKKKPTAAPMKKKPTGTTTKEAPAVAKKTASPAKPVPQPSPVETEEVYDEASHHTSAPPRNPRHILDSVEASDDDMYASDDPAPEVITINDDDDNNEEDMDIDAVTEEVLEAPEESAEAELSTWH